MINVGPGNDREGTIKLGITNPLQQKKAAFEEIEKAGYKVDFALLPDQRIGSWAHFKAKFGY